MRRSSLLLLFVGLPGVLRALSACVGDDPTAASPVDAGSGVDAPAGNDGSPDVTVPDAATARCDRTKPFGAPVLVAELNSAFDDIAARLSSDELTVYFASTRNVAEGGVGTEMFYARRTSIDAPFGAPQLLANVNSGSNDTHPMVSADDLTLFFASDRQESDAAPSLGIFTATRGAPGSPEVSPFANPTRLVAFAGSDPETSPYLTADGKELWYGAADLDVGPTLHLHRSLAPTFNGGELVTELDLPTASQRFPVLTADGLTIFFGTDRDTTAGQADIWYAKRATTMATFQTPVSASTLNALLNTPGLDDPTWISPDECRLYLSSDRDEQPGVRNIYVATRPK